MDPTRERAVTEALKSYPELAKSLDDILYGMSYCHHLSKTNLTPEFLQYLQSPPDWQTRLKQTLNPRHWHKSALWVLQALGIGIILALLSTSFPLENQLLKFLRLQHPDLTLSEAPRDVSLRQESSPPPTDVKIPASEYETKARLVSVNPNFTANKLMVLLPRLGASIEHQSFRETEKGQVTPYMRISLPAAQTEALLSELKSHGQLTWVTPPSENEIRGVIFGIELWILKEKATERNLPAKDKKK